MNPTTHDEPVDVTGLVVEFRCSLHDSLLAPALGRRPDGAMFQPVDEDPLDAPAFRIDLRSGFFCRAQWDAARLQDEDTEGDECHEHWRITFRPES